MYKQASGWTNPAKEAAENEKTKRESWNEEFQLNPEYA